MNALITKHKPNISSLTMRSYCGTISKVAKDLGIELESIADIAKNSSAIFKHLMSKYEPNSRKTKLAAFIVALDDGKDAHETVLNKFRLQLQKDANFVTRKENSQKLNTSQEKAYIPWDEVLKVYEKLKAETRPLWRNNASRVNLSKIRDFILLSMYVLIPPRRSADYYNFKLRDIDEKKDNYVLDDSLVFNSYKNSNKLGSQKVKAPKELIDLIDKWSKLNKSDWLIPSNSGKQMSQTGLTAVLNRVFGKKISSSMLRHIFLTSKYGDIDLEDLNETTKNMGSSLIERTLKYVRKNKEKK